MTDIPEGLRGAFEMKWGYLICDNNDTPVFCLFTENLAEIFAENMPEKRSYGPFKVRKSLVVIDGEVTFEVGKNVIKLDDKKVAEKMHNVLQVPLPEDLLKYLGI